MSNVWYVFQACGFASWVVLLAAVVATPFSMLAFGAVLARTRPARILAGLALAASLLPAGIGALGMITGRAKVDSVLTTGGIDPAMVERIRDEGYREAGGCVVVGAVAGAFPLLLSLIAVGLILARPPRAQ